MTPTSSGRGFRGYDAEKKVDGRKRFIDRHPGLLLILLDLYLRIRVRFVHADAGFAGRLLDWAITILKTTVEVVRKTPEQRGFSVLPTGGWSSGLLPG
ncbi:MULTISPECIES: hypothetical protein [unclassified Pseudonocardia]|uniref:hypothetical protein n=1 Tax=unclassified Pseudonocardia TaxID=2619320 RepID=UPI000761EF63|nr:MULTISPECIES: hypothetical protein [unclassified Pseudonocardia]